MTLPRTPRLLVLCALLCSGCQLSHMNRASLQAVAVAAHAGMFHRVNGRWPGDRSELEHFDCPALDAKTFDEVSFDYSPPEAFRDRRTCGFLADLEYRIELTPAPHALRMTFRDGEQLVCKLRVDAPGADSGTALAPMMTIHTSVFSCPGNGESLQ